MNLSLEHRQQIPLFDATEVFSSLRSEGAPAFLFESRSVNPIYGRMSLLGVDPILEISGQESHISFSVLQERGQVFFDEFLSSGIEEYADGVLEKSNNKVVLKINKDSSFHTEKSASKRKNIAQALRKFLDHFSQDPSAYGNTPLLGIFGAFSYDFCRLFEELPDLLESGDTPDFRFFLFDTFVRFDLIKEKSEIICYRDSKVNAKAAAEWVWNRIQKPVAETKKSSFSAKNITCDTSQEEFEEQVRIAKKLAKEGELFEIVFSRNFTGDFFGDSFALYKKYREKNPAPYLFFFDFGDEQLVGASPEMMVRVENQKVHLRPISGTRPRGKDPISDHENELELLSCPKERAELDMLIDLGRNDLRRVCEKGIEITAYRHVEKYSRVMHTIAHLIGRLRSDLSPLDAIIACQSAGTLTGAPKVQAMKEIEKHEKSRRGYYGGSIGYITFGGDMDTGIIIRTAHIKNGRFSVRVGATLLYDSVPMMNTKKPRIRRKRFLNC
jgi:anthranilate/para-aminobenzoate synthase component I